ncbi:MAG: hypothetical protein KAS72_13865 [Phycisphaerales bacterium]|nr:hypothetical protein [Phycisphaerales bacterium]
MTLHQRTGSRRSATIGAALMTLAAITTAAPADGPCFEVLDPFPDATRYYVNDMSSDGQVIIATPNDGHHGFRWERATGPLVLPLAWPDEYSSYAAAAVSDDGWTIFGYMDYATIWTIDEGQRILFDDHPRGFPQDCSADGTVAVGYSNYGGAFIWSAEGGYVPLERTAGGSFVSIDRAEAVSSDGHIVVGRGRQVSGHDLAFRWTAETGVEELTDWTSHDVTRSSAYGMSADGEVVVGDCTHIEDGYRGYRWSEEDGLELIEGREDGGATFFDVSDDGVILVGRDGYDYEAVVWDRQHGTRSLRSVLEEQCGVDLSDWSLGTATVVSADGTTIVGRAWSDDECVIYIARIERPTCPGDLDGDLDTDQQDLAILLAAYDTGSADGDLDGDGDTDQNDLGVILADYGCDL